MRKQMAFYMTQKSSKQLDEIQKIFEEKEGKVTKAYILNQSINKYYDYIIDFYNLDKKSEE
ncbi:hypothetical protein GOQ27_14375 [Clostridium sp. D2Q-11]|uniref:Uncharacterized protein n=1 Tax=Anaeromonas frigoriresistens TaxID=2683708 RepID=A0A942V4B6_9FIRM|nr:hypothetical protein [Anaeromonas frigoriresistens]MBS4539657.1 hypothetical protein [Anaeromonas frigoriresistens]